MPKYSDSFRRLPVLVQMVMAILSLALAETKAARAETAGQTAVGSTNYVNGGLNFIGDMNVATFAGNDGLYSMAIDSTTGYVLAGAIANSFAMPLGDGVSGHGNSLLTKIKLYDDGAMPTVAGYTTSYHDDSIHFGNIAGAVSMVIDTGSGLNKLNDHYAYVGASSNTSSGGLGNGGRIMKVQLFPTDPSHPDGNLDAAPKVVAVYNLNGSAGFASAVDQNYAYFLSGATMTRVDLHLPDNSANKITTITGLPNLTYYKADMVNSTLVVQALGTGVVEINVAAGNIKNTNGVLSLNVAPTVLGVDSSAPGAFAADRTEPYAYLGGGIPNNTLYSQYTTTTFQSTISKVVLSGVNMGAATPVTPLPILPTAIPADPVNVPGGQKDRTALSLMAIDPDSHSVIVGTDNNLPGNVLKFSRGASTDLSGPAFAGAVQMPYNAAYYQNTDPVLKQDAFPYRVGDINMRDVAIDPKAGYVYFGTDTNIPHLLQVQYSQKGSIKGNKITLPAGAALSSVNFYCNMPAPLPTASSSGNVRLAMYADASGVPGSLLWQSADIPDTVSNAGGWLSVTTGLPKISTTGDYWLAWQVDSTLDIPGYLGASASGFTFNQAYGDFPADVPGLADGLKPTSDQWSMYVQFNPYLHGDFNRDGQVTSADIPAMLSALTDLNSYASINALSPTQLALLGDFDNSGTVNNLDIQGLLNFVASLGGNGSVDAVPEPTSLTLLALATPFVVMGQGRRNRCQ